jgi:hypothetical protein
MLQFEHIVQIFGKDCHGRLLKEPPKWHDFARLGGCIMAEIGTFAAALVMTASAIGMAVRFGTRFIDSAARDRFSRDRPIVLPPPKFTA